MPASTEKQREAMAIAEHHPGQLYQRNRGMLKMSHSQLHDFAATKGLHKHQGGEVEERGEDPGAPRGEDPGNPYGPDHPFALGYRRLA